MGEASDGDGRERGGWWPLAILVLLLVIGGGLAFLYFNFPGREGGAGDPVAAVRAKGPYAAYAKGTLARLQTHEQPRPVPEFAFEDREGRQRTLAEYRGRITVVNIWATWCAPCVAEMPTLAALQKAYPAERLVVAPISMDTREKLPDAKSFIDVHEPLPLLHDPNWAAHKALEIKGLPATIVLDAQGREIARLSGESDWSSPEARAFFDAVLAREG